MQEIIKKSFRFIRHGRTDWNDRSLCQGQIDIELNQAGIAEAHALGLRLVQESIGAIFTSPLKRALETASIISGYQEQCLLHCVEELKERSWGRLEGISSDQMYKIEELEEADPNFQEEDTIEPRASFKSRIVEGINMILAGEEANPLIVSHGRVFLVLCEALNVPAVRQVPNTTIVQCMPTSSRWVIHCE
jgi:broad specificity phosphatase PhoE